MANSNRTNNPGNFANDREKAAEAGHKGGQASQNASRGAHNDNQRNAPSGRGGNFADDPQRAAEAGRKGGENSHGGRGRNEDY